MAALEPGKITPKTGISSFSLTASQATAVAVLQANTIILTFCVKRKLTNSQVYSRICSAGLGPYGALAESPIYTISSCGS